MAVWCGWSLRVAVGNRYPSARFHSMMAAIIMAGRTGAAFSAQLGTMQVNEEIDAFRTLGISPMDFLVLPRILALTLMMPLLCIYADVLGIAGGMLVSVSQFDISVVQYLEQTRSAVHFTDIAVGVAKSLVFGVLVAVAGCMKGLPGVVGIRQQLVPVQYLFSG
ncbi:MAG: ABC transporter permease [Gammaproteobacteria bacterium]|nr:ABC transporter permease [Gammaproteobacteria bacterium]